ncbi:proton channel OtopLc [Folsomia candida]|uniref:proton channel OtopLc n=1 Tax=Folsomia candida TaxID=158441 RepID=UPI000B8FE23A|nr:proton channel OtopLc [Folsomia candida]
MSAWSGYNVTHNIGQALEFGRKGSMELMTRLRTGSGGTQYFQRNKKVSKTTNPDDFTAPTTIPRPIPKNLSSPTMQDLVEHQELELVETKTLLVEETGTLVVKGHTKDVCIIPINTLEEMDSKVWQQHGNDHLGLVLSALYCKLLVVCGTGFSLSEVISSYIPVAFYDGFYLYLYFMSILFMTAILGNVVKEKAHMHARNFAQGVARRSRRSRSRSRTKTTPTQITTENQVGVESQKIPNLRKHSSEYSTSSSTESPPLSQANSSASVSGRRERIRARNLKAEKETVREKGTHFGSFYLRIGAVAFGVGSMIYTGLEFGQYFELKPDEKCRNYMAALTPAVRMVFTFMQMYFIFLNSKMAVSKVSLTTQYGLMHLIGTNLCIWLNVLVQETKHEILNFYNPDNNTISFRYEKAHKAYLNLIDDSSVMRGGSETHITQATHHNDNVKDIHHRMARGLKGPHTITECGRTNIMGSIVDSASPFLFPCTIEFSLICAAVCFVMWKSFAKRRIARIHHSRHVQTTFPPTIGSNRSPHHYSVDCARANKGLFVGIFFLVLTIMSIIINLVLDTREEYKEIAHLEVNITEIVLYTAASIAVLLGMYQVRVLRFEKQRNLELDNILLIVAQTGSLIFNVFTIISGHFKGEKLVLLLALSKVVQLLLQTLFILDASNRTASTVEQARRKPGREVVTYLLVTNLAMWLMNALEKSRGESHPAQLQFYGVWGWTIITHISMPLAIFYRFHSTVCLCEIWKRAFKLKRS